MAAPLSREEGLALLGLARRSLEQFLSAGTLLDPAQPAVAAASRPGGVFVTLRAGRDLRGCIGVLEPEDALPRAVARCAVSAGTQDPRFPAVTREELDGLRLELSVLSAAVPADSPAEIQVGRDGVILEAGGRRGLLLPQVAEECGWDREELLEGVCRKAGLEPGAWRTGRLLRFTAQVFREKDEPRTSSKKKARRGGPGRE